jgi:non-specific serine/threonine protein kinase
MGAPLYRSEVVRRLSLAVVALVAIACTANAPAPSSAATASAPPSGATSGTGTAATWRRIADIPTGRSEVAAAAFRGGVYVIGGFGGGRVVERYAPDTNAWTRAPDLPIDVDHAMAAAIDAGDRAGLYAIGGNSGAPTARAFVLTPDASAWREIARMPAPRSQGAAVAIGATIYVVGGYDGSRLVAPTYAYDAARDAWREVAAIPTPRDHLAAVALEGRVCAIGGRRLSLTTNLGTLECYDPAAGTWSQLPDAPTARGGVGAAAVGDQLVFVGGERPEGTYREVELYRASSRAWTRGPDLPTPRHGIGVVAIGGRIFVMTGGPTPGGSQTAVCEVLELR